MTPNPDEATRAATARAAALVRRLLRENSPVMRELESELAASTRGKDRPIVLRGLEGSTLGLVLATLAECLKRPVLLVTAGMERAEQAVDDLAFFGHEDTHHYPKWEVLPYDDEDLSLEVTAKHLDVFEALARARAGGDAVQPVICAPVDALMLRTLPGDVLEGLTVRVNWGDRVDLVQLEKDLVRAGFERVGLVESRGEFSIRGSIVDVFPPNTDDPLRLDLFGDEVESIRTFDLASQRSTGELGTGGSVVFPAARLKHHMNDHVAGGGSLVTLFDLLPANTLVVLDAPERYGEVCTYFESTVNRQYFEVHKDRTPLGPPPTLILTGNDIQKKLGAFRRIEHSRLPVDDAGGKTRVLDFPLAAIDALGGELEKWIGAIRKRQHEDYLVVVACDNDGQVQRFEEVLREHQIGCRALLKPEDAEKLDPRHAVEGYRDVLLVVGGVHEGLVLTDARIVVITDREVFGRYKRRHTYRKIYKGRAVASSSEIQRGDYVVHIDHGIGKYAGMRQQTIDGRTVDLLEIGYAEGDKLLVPVEKIRFVQKYSGADSESVTLDRLGSTRWIKRRRKSREQIEEMAEELIKLYAKRELARRDAFGPDDKWQNEFESSFPYAETPDQMKAIVEVKADMERARPMDRLVCGDVGYGKTEVAIRGVFKAVRNGKQAAILVPTTVLALQHFQTFKERFADFPVKVELLSRFQKPREITEIKKRIKSGETHVVVGTHKLLGKDMAFHDLGLLVVDEEQRFGVKAKERLKELRAEVDILTMTATPIPRTLHMALSGLRDLSLITTPPPDRHPIKTRIIHWEEELIAEAILRELNRGGQVFFIHNRIHNIEEIVTRLQKIVPHARIGSVHGQMREDELEDHMLKFVQGGYDILVSTTIVESGIDIPNANTIIVNRADAFGLAQLYQLRGRVGREQRRAYAYLLVPKGQPITETAVKRLAAIEEFTELGSGFNIAMRDMEIRGAGNLLGKEQHGVVNEIGFELYCEMLQETVARLRGIEMHDQHDVEIKWPVSCFLPAPYVPVETQRVNIYKRLSIMRVQEDVDDLREELRDRFGELPPPVVALLEVTRTRLAGARLRASLIDASGARVRVNLSGNDAGAYREALARAAKEVDGVLLASVEGAQSLVVALKPGGQPDRLRALATLLNRVYDLTKVVPAGAK